MGVSLNGDSLNGVSLNKGFRICPEGTLDVKELATSVTAAFIPSTLVAFGILKNAGLFRDILGMVFFIGLLDSIMNSAIFTGFEYVYVLRVCLVLGLGLGIILFTVTGGSGGGSTRTLAPLGLRGGFLLVTAADARSAARAAARAFTSKGFGLAIFGTTGTTGSV